MIFWGEKGEYGPFTAQEDGWPNAGEVIRYYRRKQDMSANELAILYGEAIGEQITARWILKMEQQNKVPLDITRRRVLSKILGISPFLLGLASLEQVTYNTVDEIKRPNVPVVLKNTSAIDVAKYDQYIRAHWLLSYTGEEDLKEITTNIGALEKFEQQSSGASQQYVRNILNSHYQLASDITRHQGKFTLAWFYANKAVKVTKVLSVNDFIAAALYRRGYTSLEWGIFGENTTRGMMNQEPDRKKIESAIVDFEKALLDARPQLKGAIWLELSRAQGILKQTSIALSLARQAEDMIGTGVLIADPLEQILLAGALSGLNEGMYLLGKAASFIVMGRTTTAIEVLDELEELKNGKGIARNQTRRLAYMDTLRAEASLGTKDYITAATRAMNAFHTFQDIETIDRIAWINTIYERLVQKYGHHPEVKALGRMLKEYYARAANKK